MLEIRRAVVEDIPHIMQFIGRHYRKNHILAVNRIFFEWQYVDRGKVNMYIAIEGERVYAIEGFVLYNDLDSPDMTGSMWKSIYCQEDELSGIHVDELLQLEIHPRYCYGTGYSSRTVRFHKLLGHQVIKMPHYYRLNDLQHYKIAKIQCKNILERAETGYSLRKLETIDEFKKILPQKELEKRIFYKDYHYINKRFYQHPVWKYDLWAIVNDIGMAKSVIVTRTVESQEAKCIKIVDYYGVIEEFANITKPIDDLMREKKCEYIDIYVYGISAEIMRRAGFNERTEEDTNIIPNYFEPFEQRNIDLWMMKPEIDNLILMRGDGDQDRPS